MTLKLYNTLSKDKQDFVPLDPDNVRMYVCGPTVYDFAHIGNARPVIVFDVLFRLLKHLANSGEWDGGKGNTKVIYVRNITDVDDKINARAAEEGVSIRDLTERTAKQFHEDVAALGCLPPTIEPRATEHIEEMKAMIEALVERGHAYVAEDHVLFQVSSMSDYGALSRRSLDEMEAGARVEIAPYKKDPMDFVLWKPSKDNEPGWPSPCGIEAEGRPGWHIECSAMSARHLGEQFDIHGGGIDLVFPHHENEVAQSRCAHGTKTMANIWMHNGFLQVEGEKMSKSLGNFITINELLQKWDGEVIKFAMLSTHYRQPINFTEDLLKDAGRCLQSWATAAAGAPPSKPSEAFIEALKDDLNTPQAIAELHSLRKKVIDENKTEHAAELMAGANFLGLLGHDVATAKTVYRKQVKLDVEEAVINTLIAERLEARNAKNWAEADRIRDELTEMGVQLMDAKDPETGEVVTTWEIAN